MNIKAIPSAVGERLTVVFRAHPFILVPTPNGLAPIINMLTGVYRGGNELTNEFKLGLDAEEHGEVVWYLHAEDILMWTVPPRIQKPPALKLA